MVLPVGTMSRLRSRSAWCMDPQQDRPKLFRADPDRDGNFHSNRNSDGYGYLDRVAIAYTINILQFFAPTSAAGG